MQQEIIKKVEELCKIANVPMIPVTFKTKGTTAGYFMPKDVSVDFNMEIAKRYPKETLADTVPHEVAHYVRYYRNGMKCDVQRNGRRDLHGKKWQSVMVEFGVHDAKATHDFAVQPSRKYKKFKYECGCDNWELTSIRHNRILKGRKYFCPKCKGRLNFVEAL